MISYKNAVDYNNLPKEQLEEAWKALQDAFLIYVDSHVIKLEFFTDPAE